MTANESASNDNLATLLQLEADARQAESDKALQFLMVNETRRLIQYRQAFVFSAANTRVEAASSLAVIERNAPFITWLESCAKGLQLEAGQSTAQVITADTLDAPAAANFKEHSLPHVVYCPLTSRGDELGALWLARETPWNDNEIVLIERLCGTYAHAWRALIGNSGLSKLSDNKKRIAVGTAAALLIVSFLPVRMTAVAPAEIIPIDPLIVSAPINGVIKTIEHAPNTEILAGDVLFRFEDTTLRNAHEIAARSYQVAASKLRKATQGAFGDENFKGQVTLLQAELALKETELAYAKELLDQVEVRATANGLLVYNTESDWIGKPVAVGEKIMQVVDPQQVKIRIFLPVDDAITIVDAAEVDVFLHADPLTSIKGVVSQASYDAYLTPAQILAYRVDAEIVDPGVTARIGLQGSARISGEKVSLFFYLFRRPISAVRQFFGL